MGSWVGSKGLKSSGLNKDGEGATCKERQQEVVGAQTSRPSSSSRRAGSQEEDGQLLEEGTRRTSLPENPEVLSTIAPSTAEQTQPLIVPSFSPHLQGLGKSVATPPATPPGSETAPAPPTPPPPP